MSYQESEAVYDQLEYAGGSSYKELECSYSNLPLVSDTSMPRKSVIGRTPFNQQSTSISGATESFNDSNLNLNSTIVYSNLLPINDSSLDQKPQSSINDVDLVHKKLSDRISEELNIEDDKTKTDQQLFREKLTASTPKEREFKMVMLESEKRCIELKSKLQKATVQFSSDYLEVSKFW